ncbi:MAG TPA: hypothetical protein VGZ22_02125 [Isosphaeraceae bacterium]|jgi:hypothetical protein|nr:hypothetical protein [Isosphaeraceae bacterium]
MLILVAIIALLSSLGVRNLRMRQGGWRTLVPDDGGRLSGKGGNQVVAIFEKGIGDPPVTGGFATVKVISTDGEQYSGYFSGPIAVSSSSLAFSGFIGFNPPNPPANSTVTITYSVLPARPDGSTTKTIKVRAPSTPSP